MDHDIPTLDGLLTADDIRRTAATIAAAQQPSGAIAWFVGGHTDPWDHVQAAMALTAAGLVVEAERAYAWSVGHQRVDGSWAIRYDGETITDPHTDANFCAYLATGVWHHWTTTRDEGFAAMMWPVVERGIDAALRLQRPDGAVVWAQGSGGPLADALVTGNASIHTSLRCAIALGELVGSARPDWEMAAGRIRHALDEHPESFSARPTHAMDWYYPVLGGALPVEDASAHLADRWDEFVVDSLGVRCVSTNPWVTGAETCELALALDAADRPVEAIAQLAAMQHLREADGSYWTGLVFDVGTRWPVERTTWTAATVILAVDALSRTSPANGIFRGEGLPATRWEVVDACRT